MSGRVTAPRSRPDPGPDYLNENLLATAGAINVVTFSLISGREVSLRLSAKESSRIWKTFSERRKGQAPRIEELIGLADQRTILLDWDAVELIAFRPDNADPTTASHI